MDTENQTNILLKKKNNVIDIHCKVMAIGAILKSALEIDEDTKIQFHVHRDEKHKGAASQKIFI